LLEKGYFCLDSGCLFEQAFEDGSNLVLAVDQTLINTALGTRDGLHFAWNRYDREKSSL